MCSALEPVRLYAPNGEQGAPPARRFASRKPAAWHGGSPFSASTLRPCRARCRIGRRSSRLTALCFAVAWCGFIGVASLSARGSGARVHALAEWLFAAGACSRVLRSAVASQELPLNDCLQWFSVRWPMASSACRAWRRVGTGPQYARDSVLVVVLALIGVLLALGEHRVDQAGELVGGGGDGLGLVHA